MNYEFYLDSELYFAQKFTEKKAAPTNGCRLRDSLLSQREAKTTKVNNMLAFKSEGPPTSVLPLQISDYHSTIYPT